MLKITSHLLARLVFVVGGCDASVHVCIREGLDFKRHHKVVNCKIWALVEANGRTGGDNVGFMFEQDDDLAQTVVSFDRMYSRIVL